MNTTDMYSVLQGIIGSGTLAYIEALEFLDDAEEEGMICQD